MNRKKLIAIFATITISMTLVASVLLLQLSQAAAGGYDPDYMTVEGVLASDKYTLYPYETADSLKIGFSKYGEMIDSDTCVGLEYGDVDAFAAPVGPDVISSLPKSYWMQGWFMNITYEHASWGSRNVWAMATFADMIDYGGPWLRVDWGSDDIDSAEDEPGLYGLETPEDPGYEIPGGDVLRNGGRKTNGTAVTEPIKVLYDGPRRFVALLSTTISDHRAPSPDEALVRFNITIVFNKVKKEVNLFKDVKSVISWKILEGEMNVQFSNRGQVDLGTVADGFESYAHFYTEGIGMYDVSEEGQPTVYDSEYTLIRTETPCKVDNGTAEEYTGDNADITLKDDDQTDWTADQWVGDKVAIIGGTGAGQIRTINDTASTLLEVDEAWTTNPDGTSIYAIYDPTICKTADGRWPQTSATNATYDLAQVVNPTAGYVWSAAFWPSLSDWSIDGWGQKYRSLDALDPHYINLYTSDSIDEPEVPFYIGEWDFLLGHSGSSNSMFRGVTAYSIVDQHDASDAQITGGSDVIDKEIQYLMDEKFNPYDLYNAVHKQESRWLYYDDSLTVATSYITLTEGLGDDIYQPNGYLGEGVVTSSTTWTGYNYTEDNTATFAWLNEYEDGITANSKNWVAHLNATLPAETMLKITPTGFGVNMTGSLNFSSIVDFGFWYYNNPNAGIGPSIEFELYANDGTGYIAFGAYPNDKDAPNPTTGEWIHYTLNDIESFIGDGTSDNAFYIKWLPIAGMTDDLDVTIDYAGTGHKHSWEWFQHRLGSFKVGSVGISARYETETRFADCYVDDLSVAYLDRTSGVRYERVYNMEEDKLIPTDWDAYCSFAERVLVNGTLIDREDYHDATAYEPYYTINFETGVITFHHYVLGSYTAWELSIGTHVKVLYSTIEENEKGRYEWMVVGKNAAAIDSIGAAYMTQAFDSRKDIEVLLTGLDINDTVNGPHAPFVMGGAVTGTRTNYYFDYPSDNRTALRDDWCTTYPVASSNMLFAGGPRAQMGTEYFNEFTMAFFPRNEYVTNDTGQANKIMGLSCWNRTTYGAGYAVVSVYKDLNGTIGFLIWGYNGEDTYYATKWFWDTGIVYLQTENRGVTDIILKITYTTCPYTVSIVEHLGTISEKPQHDC